ncbi:hypothetical protein DPMN_039468 [Dreissena polymorpha]|uniref:Uncharacterized protein n=1 Tax=Dreissena polymorpha TaxID=45954 RepID=A0A9D4HUA3_DREPO|nr:hypothetical protein DPMN_039468 [Dreissena polymorpha]
MAEGGMDRATSQTESVPGHSSLYSRHSQVRQGLKPPNDTTTCTVSSHYTPWTLHSWSLHPLSLDITPTKILIRLERCKSVTESAPSSKCNLHVRVGQGLIALLDTVASATVTHGLVSD